MLNGLCLVRTYLWVLPHGIVHHSHWQIVPLAIATLYRRED